MRIDARLRTMARHCAVVASMLSAASMLGACSYSTINPERAEADRRSARGEDELVDIAPDASRIVMRANGTQRVTFSTGVPGQACRSLKVLGTTSYVGQGVVYPWIARAAQGTSGTAPYLVLDPTPGRPVLLRAMASLQSTPNPITAGFSSSCGPVYAAFTPQPGHAYTADLAWDNRQCRIVIHDATKPEQPVPVAVDPKDCAG